MCRCAIALLCVLSLYTSVLAQGFYYVEEDWENGIPRQEGEGWQISRGGTDGGTEIMGPTSNMVHSGQVALISRIYNSSLTKYRAEVANTHKALMGNQYFYRFSVYFPTTGYPKPTSPGQWALFAQWQQPPDLHLGENWRNPPLAFTIDINGNMRVNLRYSPLQVNTAQQSIQVPILDEQGNNFFTMPKGQWVTFEVSVCWDSQPGGNGYLDIWRDGQQIVHYTGPTCYNDVQGPYQKMGIYRDVNIPETQTAFYDNFQMLRNGLIIYADQDTYVRHGNNALTNYGDLAWSTVKKDANPDYDSQAYLHFDYQRFNQYLVDGGLLAIHPININCDDPIAVDHVSDNWDEMTLTGDTADNLTVFSQQDSFLPDDQSIVYFLIPDTSLDTQISLRLSGQTDGDSMGYYTQKVSMITHRPMLLLSLSQ
ncbi:MAG: hypothetical protein CMJ19_09590 [Phycisphaeraceae bacterium]|nr:hypothetical protein [Phycisphaeraceae bacterium]